MVYQSKFETNKRITSIDAFRGFVVFIMIFVSDLAIIHGQIVPNWLLHYSDRLKGSGMTLVDVVLPGFLFIVGMSIPFAMQNKKTLVQQLFHIFYRTMSLLFLGVLMVYNWPSTALMGWSGAAWRTLMGVFTLLAFGKINHFKYNNLLNMLGWLGLFVLGFLFVGKHGERIITYAPFHIYPSWWGILGIIGWAYLIGSLCFLFFKNNLFILSVIMLMLFGLFPMAKLGLFNDIWLSNNINIGATLGVQPAITIVGIILSLIFFKLKISDKQRIVSAFAFITIMLILGIFMNDLYGVSKNQATPAWALFSCVILTVIWLVFYLIGDLKILAASGQNVFLTYILSAIYFSLMINLGIGEWYQDLGQINLGVAILRALLMSTLLIAVTIKLNRLGFRLIL